MKLLDLSHAHRKGHVHVRGVMQLKRLVMPFEYRVPAEDDFDHNAHLEMIEAKGLSWESQVDAFTAWRDQGTDVVDGHAVKVLDCTMYPASVNDWRVVCIFEHEGVRHEIHLRYAHPAMALGLPALKALVAQRAAASVATSTHAKAHTEKLNAIADKLQASPARLQGPFGLPRKA